MLGLEAYLKYFNKSDATVQQGIELLEKGEAFPKAPAETEEEVTKDNKDGKKKRTAQAYSITEDPTRGFNYAKADNQLIYSPPSKPIRLSGRQILYYYTIR